MTSRTSSVHCLVIVALFVVTQLHLTHQQTTTDKYTDENRPYKFGFNIEGYQHRQEEKDERGLIKGEYGFITADGYYRVTVYATDENGSFRIISMKNYYVGFPPEDPQTTPQPPSRSAGAGPSLGPVRGRAEFGSGPAPNPLQAPTPQEDERQRGKDPIELTGLTACSDCLIPTTKRPGSGGSRGGARFGGRTGGGGFRDRARGGAALDNQGPGSQRGGSGGFGGARGGFEGGNDIGGGSGGDLGTGRLGAGRSEGGAGGFSGRGGNGAGGFDRGAGGSGARGGAGGIGGNAGGGSGGSGRTTGSNAGGFGGARGDGAGGSGGPGGNRQIGSVQDGLPRGVTTDDIKALLYRFNYTVGFHGHHEDGYRNGDKEGDYFFDGRDGTERRVEYLANEFGYQPNITFVDLAENDVRRPKEETEKEYGLKGYEFKWFYRK